MRKPVEPQMDFHFVWHLIWLAGKTGEGVGAGTSPSAQPLHEAPLSEVLSSSQISDMAAIFQEQEDPNVTSATFY